MQSERTCLRVPRRAPPPTSLRRLLVPLGLGLGLFVRAANADTPSLPSIAAEHVSRHAPSDTEFARRRIELSPAGLRVRERAGGDDLEMIQDFVAKRLWFVDRRRGISHELPAELWSSPPPDDGAVPTGGLLGTEPCAGHARRAGRRGEWRGRRVESWRCLDAGGETIAREFLDRRHGIVVRRQTADGLVDELRDVRAREFDTGHFSPPPRSRAVGAREFARGAPAIGPFDERAPGAVSAR